jgi:hypothetical protein
MCDLDYAFFDVEHGRRQNRLAKTVFDLSGIAERYFARRLLRAS